MVTAEKSQSGETSRHDEDYNAEVVGLRDLHADLRVLRVRLEKGELDFLPGQYTVLGLSGREPCRPDGGAVRPSSNPTSDESRDSSPDISDKLIKRAYSFSCSLIDERGEVRRPADYPYREFYFNFVPPRSLDAHSLTPRLFRLIVGSRLFVGPRSHGNYTLGSVSPDSDVIFVSTGTGEASNNAMVAELLATGHRGRVVAVNCVRHRRDLAYLDAHRELERRFRNYRYIPLTTREPENCDPTRPDYVGRQYVQSLFATGEIDRRIGFALRPERTHVFLCGSPAMIGLPRHDASGQAIFPEPPGMIEVLLDRGFSIDRSESPGNIHFEKYW